MVQRFLHQFPPPLFDLRPNIVDGEIRTLLVDGEILGSYRRIPSHDIRANVALDAAVTQADPTDSSRAIVVDVAGRLIEERIGFAAVDTVGDALIEVNIANPGGLGTLSELYGRDFAADLVAIIDKRFESAAENR